MEQFAKLSELCLANAKSLLTALETVSRLRIGAFRVLSPISPRYTHPEVGYALDELPDAAAIRSLLSEVKEFGKRRDLGLAR